MSDNNSHLSAYWALSIKYMYIKQVSNISKKFIVNNIYQFICLSK